MGFEEDYKKLKELFKEAEKKKFFPHREIIEIGFAELKVTEMPSFDTRFVYFKKYDNKEIKIIHLIKDRDKTFMPRPDGINISLIVRENEEETSKEEFGWIEEPRFGQYDD